MGKLHPEIPAHILTWLDTQHLFWVATAPLSGSGRVNLSPKCTEGTFHIVNASQVWYEDLTGSGVETISHIREPGNGRISVLFHAFEGPPQIVRIYGKGTVYEYGTQEYDTFLSSISQPLRKPGSRAIILVDVLQVMTTCGYAVPFYEFKSNRTRLHEWAERYESHDQNANVDDHPTSLSDLPKEGMKSWWYTRNSQSIDGLPGLTEAFAIPGNLNSSRGPLATGQNQSSHSKNKDRKTQNNTTSINSRFNNFSTGVGLGICIGIGITSLLNHYLLPVNRLR